MNNEDIRMIVDAINNLQNNQRDIYDYIVLLLPFITAIIAWFLSHLQTTASFRNIIQKEQYYQQKENTMIIIEKFNDFMAYIYDFYKETKNIFLSGCLLKEDAMNDFITEYNLQLAYIFQSIKIEGYNFDDSLRIINDNLKKVEIEILKMNNIIKEFHKEYKGGNSSSIQFFIINASDIEKFNKVNKESIQNQNDEVIKIENTIIKNLATRSVKLGINRKKK